MAQVLRVAASRVPPLALRLRERAHYFQGQGPFIMGGLVNDTTPDFVIQQSYKFLNTISLNSYALKQTFELPFITACNEVGARLCFHRHV